MTGGTKIEIALDGRNFDSPLITADNAVLDALAHGEREGPAFSVSLRARPWDRASSPSKPIAAWTSAAEQVLRARAACFDATHVHPNLGDAIAHAGDALLIGPFKKGTSVHLATAILLGVLDDAPRKAASADQPSALASLDGARDDLGNAFVDAWIARNEQTQAMRSE